MENLDEQQKAVASTLVNWDEIDALPAAEQNERVVRLAVPSAYQHVSLCKIWKTAGDRIIWRNATLKNQPAAIAAGSLGNTWREARQHPTVATFETRSRAAWEAHKAAQKVPVRVEGGHYVRCEEADAHRHVRPEITLLGYTFPAQPAVAAQGAEGNDHEFVWPKNTLECVVCGKPHSGLVLTPRWPEQTASTSTEAGETLTDQPEPVKQVDTSQVETASELTLPEPLRWQPAMAEKMKVSREGDWVAYTDYAALRDQVAKLTAERESTRMRLEEIADGVLTQRDEACARADRAEAKLCRSDASRIRTSGVRDRLMLALSAEKQNSADLRVELERLKGEKHSAKLAADRWMEQGNVEDALAMADFLRGISLKLPASTPETEKTGGAE